MDSHSQLISRLTRLGAHLLFLIALMSTIAHGVRHAGDPYTKPYAYVSADLSVAARTFATEGILRLHGVPVNNNPPIANSDDYAHWPPLLPISLSFVFRLFGCSEYIAHLFMLLVEIATAITLYLYARELIGATEGALAVFFWLTTPVVVQFGGLVSQQAFGMLLMVAAMYVLERNTIWGALLLFLGVISTWEVALIAPAMWVMSLCHPAMRKRANAALIATAGGVGFIAVLYLAANSRAALDTIEAAKFYLGLSHTYSHLHPDDQQFPLPLLEQFRLTGLNNVWMLGPLGLSAIAQIVLSRSVAAAKSILVLAAPWILWCLAMHNHTARHPFELLIGAPAVAVALSWFVATGVRDKPKQKALRAAIFGALAVSQLMVLPRPQVSVGYSPEKLIEYGEAIKQATPAGAIVLAPLHSMVPVYYSERHIVRHVISPQVAQGDLIRIRQTYPNAPIYLAIPPYMESAFEMKDASLVSASKDAIIFKME